MDEDTKALLVTMYAHLRESREIEHVARKALAEMSLHEGAGGGPGDAFITQLDCVEKWCVMSARLERQCARIPMFANIQKSDEEMLQTQKKESAN